MLLAMKAYVLALNSDSATFTLNVGDGQPENFTLSVALIWAIIRI